MFTSRIQLFHAYLLEGRVAGAGHGLGREADLHAQGRQAQRLGVRGQGAHLLQRLGDLHALRRQLHERGGGLLLWR